MKIHVMIGNRENIPEVKELVSTMWENNINFSKAGDAPQLKNCTTLSICWDKWVDDKRWSNHPKFKEYIYFDLLGELDKQELIIIEIADDAVFVDRRAFLKAAYFIAKKTNGKISANKQLWATPEEFLVKNIDILNISFKDAIEASLLESS